MDFSSAKYRKDSTTGKVTTVSVTSNGISLSIPMDPANRHYAEILRQVEAGDITIAAAD
jgi:hypothetical protein